MGEITTCTVETLCFDDGHDLPSLSFLFVTADGVSAWAGERTHRDTPQRLGPSPLRFWQQTARNREVNVSIRIEACVEVVHKVKVALLSCRCMDTSIRRNFAGIVQFAGCTVCVTGRAHDANNFGVVLADCGGPRGT